MAGRSIGTVTQIPTAMRILRIGLQLVGDLL